MTMNPVEQIGIGLKLQQRRQELGLTIDEIAAQTRIRKAYLRDLEAEHFDALPGDAYVIGFLRNYALCLNLPPASIVDQYKAAEGHLDPELSMHTATDRTVRDRKKTEGWFGFWVVFLLVLLLGCGLYLFIGLSDPTEEEASVATPVITEEASNSLPGKAAENPTAGTTLDAVAMSAKMNWPIIPAGGANVRVLGVTDGSLSIVVDGQPARQYPLTSGSVLSWFVKDSISLQLENSDQVRCWLAEEELDVSGRTQWSFLSLPADGG